QTILIEAVALFIRHYLTVSTPVPPAHQDAVRAQGRARFEQFVEQLGRHLHRGHSLARRLTEELGAGREYTRAADDAVAAIGEGGP
ncbi:MAG: CopG family transcriptional regulator, partial [Acidimicrobiales bacterium]